MRNKFGAVDVGDSVTTVTHFTRVLTPVFTPVVRC